MMNNREWCYVESALPGSKKWDYCKPIMDYDKVRCANQDAQKLITADLEKVNSQISQNIQPAQQALDRLKKISNGQEELFKKITEIFSVLEKINLNLSKLYNTKDAWDKQEKLTKDLKFQIEQKAEKIKEEEEKEIESIVDPNEIYKKESSHEVIMATKKAGTKNCKGMMLYEDEEEGDGLIGMYYDNESWIGSYKERKDQELNFDWTGIAPKKDINPNNFSVVWNGFVYIPYTGMYTFTLEADDGVELTVNREIIISYRMNNSLDDPNEKKLGFVNSINSNKVSSEKIRLNAGSKISIKLRYYHTIHNEINEDQQSFIKLLWSSDELAEKILPNKYLFSTNDLSPLKITGFNSEDAILRKLDNNEFAFKNSDKYIIQDIPPQYLNMMTLRYNKRYMKDKLSFIINTPSVIYIALIAHYPHSLPDDFEKTELDLSLLYIPEKPGAKSAKKILAQNSTSMQIYKKSYPAGRVEIYLNNKQGINKYGIPMLVFLGFDQRGSIPILCFGKEINLTNSYSPYFDSCKASSEKDNWKCESGFNEKMRDEEGGMWSSNNEGEGAWIEVKLKGLFEFTKFYYKDKKNPAERNRQIELLFSNGKIQSFNLKNSDEVVHFLLDSVRASSVKITIKSVYGSINNGGAFKFMGYICHSGSDEDNSSKKYKLPELVEFEEYRSRIESMGIEIQPMFQRQAPPPLIFSCRDSMSNSNIFDDININEGQKILIKCYETCASATQDIYGGPLYSKDSAICKAAYHSGKLPLQAGLVVLVIKKGIKNYLSNNNEKRHVKSKSRGYSSLSISFELYEEEDPIIMKKGSKVDFYENGIWHKAFIDSFSSTKNGNFLKLHSDGGKSLPIEVKYPNPNIAPCGSHTKNRVCKGSIKNYVSELPIKIRFTPPNFPNGGDFLPDNGEIYGLNGKSYGWSRSMKDFIITNINTNKAELETYVIWPPSNNSKFCTRPNPEIVCEPVIYAIWVGKGKFKIKLYIGDVKNDIKADFTINGKTILKNEKIMKNELKIFQTEIDSLNEFIFITSECKEDCYDSQSKLNAIEIQLIKHISKDKKAKEKEKKLSCGEAFTGGRCQTGPDVLHCLFDDKFSKTAGLCAGENSLVEIPENYKCQEQKHKYKCVKIRYGNEDECKLYCPKKCQEGKCLY